MHASLRAHLSSVGVEVDRELDGGQQSIVLAGRFTGRDVVVKIIDGRHTDPTAVQRRARLAVDLADIDPRVVAPLRVDGRLVLEHGDDLITLLPRVDGRTPDLDIDTDAAWLGGELAMLHESLRHVEVDLPPIAALRVPGAPLEDDDWQLLHGDPSAANILRDGAATHILDLGEAGTGPPAYDVALALFVRRFDRWQDRHPESSTGDDTAGIALLHGYESASGHHIAPGAVDDWLEHRREALAWWIEHPDRAPVGIRTSPPEWFDVLRAFVADDRTRTGTGRG